MHTRRDAGDRADDRSIDFSRVSLPGDGKRSLEAESLRHHPIQFIAFTMIAIKETEEGRLCPGGSLHAAELQLGNSRIDLLQVQHQILRPQCRPLADRGELRRLVMRVPKRGLILPRHCKIGQRVDGVC